MLKSPRSPNWLATQSDTGSDSRSLGLVLKEFDSLACHVELHGGNKMKDLMGIRAAWHKFTYMPEYVEHKHEYCTDEDAINIFAVEQMARKVKSNEKSYWFDKAPAAIPDIRGFDGVAIILAVLCLGSTAIASILV